ncbi:MAG TPA: MaoC family dehydratase [Stellaceae bacterium]|jgi:acyl dehydratase
MTAADLAVPQALRRFEDYVPGGVYEYGPISLDEAEIVDFARRYDPQPIHIDPEAAAAGPFGGLIASGWQTVTVMMRLLVAGFLPGEASLGSPGIDELRWTRPVRPGDALRIRVTILAATRSRSRRDRGMVRTLVEVLNQKNEVVMSLKAMNLMRCRNSAASPPPRAG